jgi:ATP-dependent HslUV protease, peptidase subunit HslV
MSIVVAVQKENTVVIATDTLTKRNYEKLNASFFVNKSKLIQFGDSWIAPVGTSVHMDVLKSLFEKYPDLIHLHSRTEVFETYVRIHRILRDEYFLNATAEKSEDEYETSRIGALIVNPCGIFEMLAWRNVNHYSRFYAIGSGSDYALGAMYSVYDRFTAAETAEAGIRAACEFDDSSALPMELHEITLQPRDADGSS